MNDNLNETSIQNALGNDPRPPTSPWVPTALYFTFQTYYCGSGYGTPVRSTRRPSTIPKPYTLIKNRQFHLQIVSFGNCSK